MFRSTSCLPRDRWNLLCDLICRHTRRTSEIGLRFALGARPADVFRLVIGGSTRLVVWGLALGLIGTLALSRVLQTLLFGVGPQDSLTIAGVVATLGLSALVGSSVPALRAARLDPAGCVTPGVIALPPRPSGERIPGILDPRSADSFATHPSQWTVRRHYGLLGR
jgi:FtsX-like permease family